MHRFHICSSVIAAIALSSLLGACDTREQRPKTAVSIASPMIQPAARGLDAPRFR